MGSTLDYLVVGRVGDYTRGKHGIELIGPLATIANRLQEGRYLPGFDVRVKTGFLNEESGESNLPQGTYDGLIISEVIHLGDRSDLAVLSGADSTFSLGFTPIISVGSSLTLPSYNFFGFLDLQAREEGRAPIAGKLERFLLGLHHDKAFGYIRLQQSISKIAYSDMVGYDILQKGHEDLDDVKAHMIEIRLALRDMRKEVGFNNLLLVYATRAISDVAFRYSNDESIFEPDSDGRKTFIKELKDFYGIFVPMLPTLADQIPDQKDTLRKIMNHAYKCIEELYVARTA